MLRSVRPSVIAWARSVVASGLSDCFKGRNRPQAIGGPQWSRISPQTFAPLLPKSILGFLNVAILPRRRTSPGSGIQNGCHFFGALNQQLCCTVRRLPIEENLQRHQQIRIGHGNRNCFFLSLDIVKVRQFAQIRAQIVGPKIALETSPSKRLCLIFFSPWLLTHPRFFPVHAIPEVFVNLCSI